MKHTHTPRAQNYGSSKLSIDNTESLYGSNLVYKYKAGECGATWSQSVKEVPKRYHILYTGRTINVWTINRRFKGLARAWLIMSSKD